MLQSTRPIVQHSYEHHHLAASRWNDFEVRPDDIVISTSYKAGTTWMQTIVGNIIFHEAGPPASISELSPWLDMRIFPEDEIKMRLADQIHRRFIKTHLPLDGLVFHEGVKYIVVSRDPRDVFMSLLNHYGSHTDEFFEIMNNTPDRPGDPFPRMNEDIHEFWQEWLTKGWFDWESDGFPYWSHLHHCKTWWEFRHLPNIEFFHYSDMLRDLPGEMQRVADYLEIQIPEESWPRLVDACTFATVKKNPRAVTGDGIDVIFKGGPDTFINKGTNGRWRDVLTDKDLELYAEVIDKSLDEDCANWLEGGGTVG
jgi:aryl sulfotransferase